MSTSRKKGSRRPIKETRTDNLIADVTVNDFANTLRINARLKKSATNVLNKVKEETTKEEKVWDETEEENVLKENLKEKKNRRRSKCQKDDDNFEDEGINYPLDIWFIISEYIQPEAVGKFAKICKSSYYVTTTGKFWFHLYKLYYKFVPNLPERLQPQCMRLHGLRACVIRALHYCYFIRTWKIESTSYLQSQELYSLEKRKCILMWHKEVKGRWNFYFKLKEVSKTRNHLLKRNKQHECKKIEFLDTSEDVAVNPEDDCKVLKVCCLRYSMLPPVIGLVLQRATMKLMPGFREQGLELGFGTSDIPSTLTSHVTLRNVMGLNVLNWWDPTYPHQDVSHMIELPQNDSWD
ncbi:hypothetical protein PUN28_005603 [Cardiocondyla obscurior]|uniref:Transmembrane protein 183 n=1 Tax=Cardiocondyla obscurior TaxID=286306 RepID=A0AAW2GGT1_9HYME